MAKEKEITINNLADKFDDLTTMVKNDIEDLTFMTKRGFDEMSERFEKVEGDIDGLKMGQQRIEMRLIDSSHN